MMLTRSTVVTALGAFVLAACSQAATDNQVAADAAPAAQDVAATGTNTAGSEQSAGSNAPATTSVSSGMPVPGTNTPEHVVVNEDSANADGNRQ